MAYITSSTSRSLLYNWDIDDEKIKHHQIYKSPIFMFSQYEEHELKVFQELLSDPSTFSQHAYRKLKATDSFSFIYEGKTPRYHKDLNCPFLNANYENFEIPQEIKEKGPESVKEFRAWFKSVEHLFKTNKLAFIERLRLKYGIVTNIRSITKDNSGAVIMDNYDIVELEADIDKLIKASGRFYYKSSKHTTILKQYSKFSFLGNSRKPLQNNHTGYSDEEVKELLREYESTFKKPLKAMLMEYYKLKLNPDIFMEGNLLEQLGLQACYNCHNENPDNKETINQINKNTISNSINYSEYDDDDLPF